MQISRSSLPLPAGGASRRDGAFGNTRTPDGSNGRADEAAARTAASRPRARISATSALDESRADSLQNLPAKSRNALQSYLSNGPSIQERLGVELAGVDIFV